jgi:hypothetical protein
MDFLKKHYEKIILGVVLIGLAVAVAVLPFFISSEKDKLTQMKTAVLHPKVKPLTNLDLTLPEQALQANGHTRGNRFWAPKPVIQPDAMAKGG